MGCHDYLIVGQGLAGSVMALLMRKRGLDFLVVDNGNPSAASKVAAGIINPITGGKLVKSRRVDELFPHAFSFYREAERELGQTWLEDRRVDRFLPTPAERCAWRGKKDDPGLADWLAPLSRDWPEGLRAPPSDGQAAFKGGLLHAAGFLRSTRELLEKEGRFVEGNFSWAHFRQEKETIRWGEIQARRVVFCEGHRVSGNPFFPWIPFRHAKGEILTVEWGEGGTDRIFNCGKWLVPHGDGTAKAGSTFEWRDLTETPTAKGEEEILAGLSPILKKPLMVLDRRAGIRPVARDTLPVVGIHPGHPRLAIFNGLGAKGVLAAPFYAEQLLSHLEDGIPPDPAVDTRRNF